MELNRFIQTQENTAHCSFLYQLQSKYILLLWFSGDETSGDCCKIHFSYVNPLNNEYNISEPVVIVSKKDFSCQNPVIIEKNNKLILWYSQRKPNINQYTEEDAHIFRIERPFNSSNPKSDLLNITNHWSEPCNLVIEDGLFCKSGVIDSKIPIYSWVDHKNYIYDICMENISESALIKIENTNLELAQPHIIKDNHGYKCYYRDRLTKYIYMNESTDLEHWTSVQPINLINNDSGICIVYCGNNRYIGIGNTRLRRFRTPITIFISVDGKCWKNVEDIDLDVYLDELSSKSEEFSYPYMILDNNNNLIITYTHERKRIKFIKYDKIRWEKWFVEPNINYLENYQSEIDNFLVKK